MENLNYMWRSHFLVFLLSRKIYYKNTNITKKLNNLKVFTTSVPKYKAELKATTEKYLMTA